MAVSGMSSASEVEERPRVLHWFRSDLRLDDNVALWAAANRASGLACVFVFDDALLRRPGMRGVRLHFLYAALSALSRALERRGHPLIVKRGDPVEVVPALARRLGVRVVTWNRDPSGLAKRRDARVSAKLEAIGVRGVSFKDRVVFEARDVAPAQDRPVAVFSPYRKTWWQRHRDDPPRVRALPRELPPTIASGEPSALPAIADLGAEPVDATLPDPGAAMSRLDHFLEGKGARYRADRDRPDLEATSKLSADLRFGTLSIRTALARAQEAIRADDALASGVEKWIDELLWREFYHAILDEDPSRVARNHRPAFDRMAWEDDDAGFEAWSRGETGYPFVDAGIRALRATGYLHNRLRMVTASFLVKDLLVDWRRGARFFMEQLVDGDPASNSGGWQWAASTGTDDPTQLRIFNPVLQGEKFDPNGDFVRRWVPELEGFAGAAIHRPWEAPLMARGYPAPIVDHGWARERAVGRYGRMRA